MGSEVLKENDNNTDIKTIDDFIAFFQSLNFDFEKEGFADLFTIESSEKFNKEIYEMFCNLLSSLEYLNGFFPSVDPKECSDSYWQVLTLALGPKTILQLSFLKKQYYGDKVSSQPCEFRLSGRYYVGKDDLQVDVYNEDFIGVCCRIFANEETAASKGIPIYQDLTCNKIVTNGPKLLKDVLGFVSFDELKHRLDEYRQASDKVAGGNAK